VDWLSVGVAYLGGAGSGFGLKFWMDRSNRSKNSEAAIGDGAHQSSFKDINVGGDFAGRDIHKK
jgi:hypothetical protein